MRRFVTGMSLGVLITVAAMVPMALKLRQVHRDKGRVEGKMEAVLALEKHFGIYPDSHTGAYERVFSVKCADVLAITLDNVKTVRTTRPGDDNYVRASQMQAAKQGDAK